MLKSVEGTYKEGRVSLSETREDAKQPDLLRDYGIDETQATDLRGRLRSFEEDWNRPEMDTYDAL